MMKPDEAGESRAGSPMAGVAPPPPSLETELGWLETELAKIVGQEVVKKQLKCMARGFSTDRMRRQAGFFVDDSNGGCPRWTVFRGNPGTGKTTIGRIMAMLLERFGICRNHNFKVVQCHDLFADAIKTREVVEEAKGSILFIKEAYRLADYSSEVLETLMRSACGGQVVILAGHPAEMFQFLSDNPGLGRRTSWGFHFDDYTADDLAQILTFHVQDQGYEILPSLKGDPLVTIIKENTKESTRKAMNASMCDDITRHAISYLNDRIFLDGAAAPGTAFASEWTVGQKGQYFSEGQKTWYDCSMLRRETDGGITVCLTDSKFEKTIPKEKEAMNLRKQEGRKRKADTFLEFCDSHRAEGLSDAQLKQHWDALEVPSPSVQLTKADLVYGCQQVDIINFDVEVINALSFTLLGHIPQRTIRNVDSLDKLIREIGKALEVPVKELSLTHPEQEGRQWADIKEEVLNTRKVNVVRTGNEVVA